MTPEQIEQLAGESDFKRLADLTDPRRIRFIRAGGVLIIGMPEIDSTFYRDMHEGSSAESGGTGKKSLEQFLLSERR